MRKDSIAKTFAKNLKKVRLSRHLTQADVAKRASISTTHYARIERGESIPSIVTAAILVKSLKVGWSEILPFKNVV